MKLIGCDKWMNGVAVWSLLLVRLLCGVLYPFCSNDTASDSLR